jgi:hypothetical protein
MGRQLLTAVFIILFALLFVEWMSSIFVHPCPQGSVAGPCPYESGIVVEGMKLISRWSPQVWSAIALFVIALFAGTLGIFTTSLADSTQLVAEAAKLNAQVAVAAERAHLFVQIELESILGAKSQPSQSGSLSKERPGGLRLSYALKNYGKTPAMIRELSHGVLLAPAFPSAPKYLPVPRLPADILGAGEKTPPILMTDFPQLTANDAMSVEELFTNFWFYGLLVYDDTFGWRRTLDFVWQYNTVLHGLRVFRHHETGEKREV